ncbi:FAD-dependent oxidoreductase [Cognatishimia sp.]|uniref:FAD-dependent oxidoreductase n=1 Tax=Cognatishimia sp. TaxID=2211648 RepID=UPI0035158A1D
MVQARYSTAFTLYPYKANADQTGPQRRVPVLIVGGGPVGLATALDLGRKGTPVLLLDDHEGPGLGSKAICFAKRTLDIAHRLGAGQTMVDKGVVWNIGKVFNQDDKLFEFNLLPEGGHRNPAFINLQQPYFEHFLHDAILDEQTKGAPIEIRGLNRVTSLESKDDHVVVSVDTPDESYVIEADWLIACDGARSPLRTMLGLGFDGRIFEDNFLIADVEMRADFPTERWFWFRPPFTEAQSTLLHKQPDDIWRIDFQLGWDIDRQAELDPDRIRARVDAMLSFQTGEVPEYDLHWTSIYTFQCRRMQNFRHGRVFFAGDSAHQVSPFGARGANSGMQDAENLAWKLHAYLQGDAPETLLDSYNHERGFAADENILNSSRSTDFMTPKSGVSMVFRDAVLDLAQHYDFARPLVNSGRLSMPCVYDDFPLFGADELAAPPRTRPGASCTDAPVAEGFLLDHLPSDFALLVIGDQVAQANGFDDLPVVSVPAPSPELKDRYLGDASGAVYLIRPDHHIVARWATFDAGNVNAAHARALGKET